MRFRVRTICLCALTIVMFLYYRIRHVFIGVQRWTSKCVRAGEKEFKRNATWLSECITTTIRDIRSRSQRNSQCAIALSNMDMPCECGYWRFYATLAKRLARCIVTCFNFSLSHQFIVHLKLAHMRVRTRARSLTRVRCTGQLGVWWLSTTSVIRPLCKKPERYDRLIKVCYYKLW